MHYTAAINDLTKKDAYFIGYADSYKNSVDQMKRENAAWQAIVDKWPDGDAIPELKQRIAINNAQISRLERRIYRILSNISF